MVESYNTYNSENRIGELYDLLNEKKTAELTKLLRKTNPVDIEDFIDQLDKDQAVVVFRLLTKDDAVEVFAELEQENRDKLIEGFSDPELFEILSKSNFDDMIDALEEMPASVVEKILRQTDPQTRQKVNTFLNFPEDSAASIMTTEFMSIKAEMTCGQALERIKLVGKDKVDIYTCYVVSQTKKLLGYVSLRMIVTSPLDKKISELMYEDVISVNTLDDQEEVAKTFKKYGFTALPVVDKTNRLVGIITVDDILDIMEEEATEDIQIMAATTPDEESYSKSTPRMLAKNRIPRLIGLMLLTTVSSSIMSNFEHILKSVFALSLFTPMLTDAGGNAGSQSSTLVIRSMATGDIEFKDRPKVIFKEFRVGVITGVILGTVAFLKCSFLDQVDYSVALVVAVTIFVIFILANVIGAVLPLLADKLGFDPAIMASPLITTIVDALGLFTYFTIAKYLLGI